MGRTAGVPERVGRMRRGEMPTPQPATVAAWRERVSDGTAAAACDRIIRTRPLPSLLLDVLARTQA